MVHELNKTENHIITNISRVSLISFTIYTELSGKKANTNWKKRVKTITLIITLSQVGHTSDEQSNY
jgi:hypothetical protein